MLYSINLWWKYLTCHLKNHKKECTVHDNSTCTFWLSCYINFKILLFWIKLVARQEQYIRLLNFWSPHLWENSRCGNSLHQCRPPTHLYLHLYWKVSWRNKRLNEFPIIRAWGHIFPAIGLWWGYQFSEVPKC